LRWKYAGRGGDALADMAEDGEIRKLSMVVIRLLLQLKKAAAMADGRSDSAEPSRSVRAASPIEPSGS
jgi:hypothetical protein